MDDVKLIFSEMGFDVKEERLPEAVLYSAGRTFSLLSRELGEVYRRFGLTAASFNLLLLLKNGRDPENFSQHEVGERLVVSPSNMTGLIDRLEARGLVRRGPGRDRRSKILRITGKGSKLVDEVWPHHAEAVKRLPRALTYEETKLLVSLLAKVRRSIEA